MKVVLTKPFIIETQRTTVTIPSGLLCIASYLRKQPNPPEVKILDPDIFDGGLDDFVSMIVFERPDVVGMCVFSHVLRPANQLISNLKKVLPEAAIVIGGYHVNAVGETAFEQIPLADYMIQGEGEKSFTNLCQQLSDYSCIVNDEAIRGLIYRDGTTIKSIPNEYTLNLGELDPLDFSLIDLSAYFRQGSPMGIFRKGNHVAQIITTRGCPFPCTFCAASLNMGKKVRRRSVKNIIVEIETLIKLGADEIHIMDDNFTLYKKHVIDLCQEIITRKLDITISMPNGIRLDLIDEEMLFWMKKAGWYHLGFGIEVGSDEALKIIKKNINMAKIEEKVKLIKKVGGITVTGFFILGFPHDTITSIQETAAIPDRMGLDSASFGNFTPLPGTPSYRELVEKGEINKGYLPSFASGKVTYSPPNITHEQLAKIQSNITLKYWLHPRRIKLVFSRLKLKDTIYAFRRLYQLLLRP